MLVALSLPAFALTLDHTPLKVGQPATLTVTGATPGAVVGVVYSLAGEGAGPCPPQLGGQCLGVLSPTLYGTTVANAQGRATFQIVVPAAAPLVDVALQAAQVGAAPAVSPALTSPLLGTWVGNAYLDVDVSRSELRHLWSFDGVLTVDSRAVDTTLELPDLEVLGALDLSYGVVDDVRLPALVSLGWLHARTALYRAPSMRITLDSLPEIGSTDPSALDVRDGDIEIHAPLLTRIGTEFRLDEFNAPTATVVLDLPILDRVGSLMLLNLNGVPALDTLTTIDGQLSLGSLRDPGALDAFPALETVGTNGLGTAISITGSAFTSIDRIGTDTLLVGSGAGQQAFDIRFNPALTSINALPLTTTVPARFGIVSSNAALPTCVAEAVRARTDTFGDCRLNLADACSGAQPNSYDCL
ncbi:MAG: hypothetical protein H6738_11790 [Alphaproteobacteria bacterium]|nr:hypothetical protein [Alphaproteobacteria bacterium]MCB9697453.1 hypothetical protein [Alphaproteobacteria bacterium]